MLKSLMRGAISAAAIVPTLVFAQVPGQFNTLPPPSDVQRMLGYQQGQQTSTAPTCPKLCSADNSPCDPIYMKEADGRCDGITGSFTY